MEIVFTDRFKKKFSKIKDGLFRVKVGKQITKIIDNPLIGKPMKNSRKGTRELYISPYRLSYAFFFDGNKIIFLDIYHKDNQ